MTIQDRYTEMFALYSLSPIKFELPPSTFLEMDFSSTFGMCEQETAAKRVIEVFTKYAQDNWATVRAEHFILDLEEDAYRKQSCLSGFGILIANGWIEHIYPNGCYRASQGFYDRLVEKAKAKGYIS